MHLVHNNQAPSYLVDSVTATASLSYRGRLRSASSQRYEQPRTRLKFGERCIAFAGPAAWNSLPSSVQELTDTAAFKHQLKKGTLWRKIAYIFRSILKVYTIRYFSIAKLFLIALLRNNYFSPKCIGD